MRGEEQGEAFVNCRLGGLTWQVRSTHLTPRIEEILRDPEAFLVRGTRQFKNGRSSKVVAGDGLVMKRPKLRKPRNVIVDLFRPSRARKALHRARQLEQLGIASARPIAAGEKRCLGFLVRSYFLMEEIPGAVKLRAWTGDKRQAAEAVARLLAQLHAAGFTHRDLKDGNIVFDPGGRPHLIDLDGLRHLGSVSNERAAANLARLARIVLVLPRQRRRDDFQSLLSLGQRLRFLRRYLDERGLGDWRWWWKQIDRIASANVF